MYSDKYIDRLTIDKITSVLLRGTTKAGDPVDIVFKDVYPSEDFVNISTYQTQNDSTDESGFHRGEVMWCWKQATIKFAYDHIGYIYGTNKGDEEN